MMRKMCLIQIEKETGLLEQYIKLGAFKETIIKCYTIHIVFEKCFRKKVNNMFFL